MKPQEEQFEKFWEKLIEKKNEIADTSTSVKGAIKCAYEIGFLDGQKYTYKDILDNS